MIDKHTRIKIAIQKSGRLTDHSLDLLERCGLKYTRGRDQLIGYGENMPVDLLFVRDDDIPDLVRDDVCDLGIVGRNVAQEKQLAYFVDGNNQPFIEVCPLDFGHCRLAFGYPETGEIQAISDLEGSTIATSYPFIVRDFLKQKTIAADVEIGRASCRERV